MNIYQMQFKVRWVRVSTHTGQGSAVAIGNALSHMVISALTGNTSESAIGSVANVFVFTLNKTQTK